MPRPKPLRGSPRVPRGREVRGKSRPPRRALVTRWLAVAADIAAVLGRDTPRAQEDWPEDTARPVPPLLDPLVAMDELLPPFGNYLLGAAIALDTLHTGHVPALDPKTATVQEARDYMIDRQARIWPGLVKHLG
jgi:hypothetical protein